MGGGGFDMFSGAAAHLRKSPRNYGASVSEKPRYYLIMGAMKTLF
jgi:hypothetical protein